jgi:hypothetical protein
MQALPMRRDQDPYGLFDYVYSTVLDPSSLSDKVEQKVTEGGIVRECRLDDIVEKIEKPDKNGKWPWRKS